MKYKLLFLFFLIVSLGFSQEKREREHRIRKSQFPENALGFVEQYLEGAKRIRFYKEIDGSKTSYETKFKKDRLFYSVEFDENGVFEDLEILIKKVDVPDEVWKKITDYFNGKFDKTKVRRIQQQYPIVEGQDVKKTLKNGFQNLLLPSINYELIIATREDGEYREYEVLFDAEGNFKNLRKSLPPNYDHILY